MDENTNIPDAAPIEVAPAEQEVPTDVPAATDTAVPEAPDTVPPAEEPAPESAPVEAVPLYDAVAAVDEPSSGRDYLIQ